MKMKVGMLFMYNISVCVTEMRFTSLLLSGRVENSVNPNSCNVWSCLLYIALVRLVDLLYLMMPRCPCLIGINPS